MENDKTFELLTKMYSEMSKRFDDVNKKFDDVNKRFDEVSRKLDTKADKSDIIRIENKLNKDSKALFDGYVQNSEQLTRINNKIDELSDKVDKHDIKIQVIEGGKTKKL